MRGNFAIVIALAPNGRVRHVSTPLGPIDTSIVLANVLTSALITQKKHTDLIISTEPRQAAPDPPAAIAGADDLGVALGRHLADGHADCPECQSLVSRLIEATGVAAPAGVPN